MVVVVVIVSPLILNSERKIHISFSGAYTKTLVTLLGALEVTVDKLTKHKAIRGLKK